MLFDIVTTEKKLGYVRKKWHAVSNVDTTNTHAWGETFSKIGNCVNNLVSEICSWQKFKQESSQNLGLYRQAHNLNIFDFCLHDASMLQLRTFSILWNSFLEYSFNRKS